jgi:hypothetical protein
VEFDLADLDVYVKEFIEDAGVIVSNAKCAKFCVVLPTGGATALADMDPEEALLRL